MTQQQQWATISDAAEHYGVSEKSIRRWIAADLLEAKRVGPRLIRVNLASLDALGHPVDGVGGALA